MFNCDMSCFTNNKMSFNIIYSSSSSKILIPYIAPLAPLIPIMIFCIDMLYILLYVYIGIYFIYLYCKIYNITFSHKVHSNVSCLYSSKMLYIVAFCIRSFNSVVLKCASCNACAASAGVI